MKTLIRRLRQLEVGLIPKVDHRMEKVAAILKERRRAQLAASGQSPEEELDWSSLDLPPGTRLSCAETLRFALRLKRDRKRAARVEMEAKN